MRATVLCTLLIALLCAVPGAAQSKQATPTTLVSAYGSLADTILSVRESEANLVKAVLDHHFRAAQRAMKRSDWKAVGAQIGLFASEGDNAVAGVRKRLQQGGHHYNADDAAEGGKFEPGFVVVSRQQKRKMMNASKALLQAENDAAREAAWEQFKGLAESLIK